MKKIIVAIAAAAALLFGTAACATEADTVNHNLSKDAEGFKIQRQITFINGVTDKYLLVIEGRCSIETPKSQVDVICKNENGKYVRHSLGLSDNVFWVSKQLLAAEVDPNHYAIVFRPQTIVPNIDRQTSSDATNQEIPEGSGDATTPGE